MRLASLAALTTGGVVLGRGVVGVANSRAQLVEVAGASAPLADAPAQVTGGSESVTDQRAAPTFSSSLRSWAAPAVAATDRSEPQLRPLPAAEPQSIAASTAANAPTQTYTVAAGDTLSQIADRYAVDVAALASANGLADANFLVPGARLSIPSGAARVQSAASAAARPPASVVAGPTPALTGNSLAIPLAAPSTTADSTTPDGAVRSFYALVEQRQFDLAAGLWSQRMRQAYPPAENITGRFAQSQALTVSRAEVLQVDDANSRATVAVRLAEVVGSPPAKTLQYGGEWHLVRGPAGWLLDQPALQQQQQAG